MTDSLLDTVRRYTEAHSGQDGIAQTPIPGLTAIRVASRTALGYAIQKPLACLVLQGAKHVTMGKQSYTFAAGDSLLIMADVPTASQITQASAGVPYVSLVLDLDPAIIAELATEMTSTQEADHSPVRFEQTDAEVADAALRLMRLLERPGSIPVLQSQLLREFHYWLLAGRHGDSIRRLGLPNGHVQRVARAIALLRAEYNRRLPVGQLAAVAGMSPSSFHQNFRAVTSLTPLQFQKQLRLIEARRLMLTQGANASHAAFSVGYESVHQFTREYGRMFGLPPAKDMAAASGRIHAAA
ncbi:AraC family transcriptional regulator [Undibacterium sp. CY18W]|uniref:AraC family transcriptional regulator n=1 Tax=Undibacterium hunanense TaxID=2762292 RepID=A0ABR6ZMW0_9BURK|nr:AraC family transcriptional regulator [Undibacterium hunanense]MBC3916755.1 AraC family transcriptional regulator [Undibacterium hunanense]